MGLQVLTRIVVFLVANFIYILSRYFLTEANTNGFR